MLGLLVLIITAATYFIVTEQDINTTIIVFVVSMLIMTVFGKLIRMVLYGALAIGLLAYTQPEGKAWLESNIFGPVSSLFGAG